MNHEQIAQGNPSRPPHWLYELAKGIAKGTIQDHGEQSPLLATTVAFLRAGGNKRGSELASSPLGQAYRLFRQNTAIRWELEARILAGQSDAEIGQLLNLSEEVVDLFEQVFWRHRDGLGATDYIAAQAFRYAHWRGFQNHELREFLAWAGWTGGKEAIDLLVDALPAEERRSGRPTLSVYLDSNSRAGFELQAFVANSVISPYGASSEWSVELSLRLREAKMSTDQETALRNLQQQVIEIGRRILAGEPLPKVPRRPKGSKKRSAATVRPGMKRAANDQGQRDHREKPTVTTGASSVVEPATQSQ